MYKTLTRLLCIGLILALSIPMVACDQLFSGGLVGELINSTTPDPEPLPESDVLQDHTEKDTFAPDFESEIATHAPDETLTDMTIEYTTEPPTTEPSTTEPPIVDELPIQVIAAKSLDYLRKLPSQDPIFDGGYDSLEWEKNPIATVDHLTDSLEISGWVAFYTATEGTVGYSINGRNVIYNESFTYTAESGVQDHVTANVPGAQSACRMKFQIPTEELDAGNHTVQLVAKDADGNEELLCKFTLIKTMPYQENVHKYYAFDALYLNDEMYVTGGLVVSELSAQNNCVTVLPDQEKGSIKMRGWAAFADAPAVEYGYYIGDEIVIVTDPSFLMERPDLAYAGILNGTGFTITVPLSDVPAGIHPVGIIAKTADGTYAQLYSFYVKIVPETEPQTVVLGVRDGAGGVFQSSGDGAAFGQKIPLGQAFLEQITITSLATYCNNNNSWELRIWQWNSNYSTTVSGTVLYKTSGTNHTDCADLIVDVPIDLLISGDIYYEFTYRSGSGFGAWTAKDVADGIESYVDGIFLEGSFASSIVVGLVP